MISLNSSLRHMQRGIARALHRPIQQAVASSLARLETNSDLATDPSFLTDVRTKIDHSLGALHTGAQAAVSLGDVFTDMTEVWEGVADISVDISVDTFDLLSAFPAPSQSIAELAQEAVSNAVRHGEARRIAVSLEVTSGRHGQVATLTNTGEHQRKVLRWGNTNDFLSEQLVSRPGVRLKQ